MAKSFALFLCGVAASLFSTTDAAIIPHNRIPVWPEPEPTDAHQFLAVKFKPQLKIFNGCQSYPAVDADGNTGSGLRQTGAPDGSCSDKSKGQVYGRTANYRDAFAIMYSWYMPKDSPSSSLGHRHDWENVVVWLDSDNPASARIIAVAASAHGDYKKSYPINSKYVADGGVSAKIGYRAIWPANHALELTTSSGSMQPLILWDQLTQAARDALENTDFGSAHVPFRSVFESYLAEAYFK
jgi:hypothetical protein